MSNPVPDDLLDMLVCPEDRTKLTRAQEGTVEALNAAIAAGKVKNKGGQVVSEPVVQGLVRADGAVLYPVREFAVLLHDEGIPTGQWG